MLINPMTLNGPMLDRRSLLSLGAFGLSCFGGVGASQANIDQKRPTRAKSVLLLYMDGGPSHIDMFDLKPNAPDQIRGPAKPIDTSVPGITIGDYLPNVAKKMHHLAQIRSMRHEDIPHDQAVYRVLTGYRHNIQAGGLRVTPRDMPHMACSFNRASDSTETMPKSIQLPEPMRIDARILPGQNAGLLGERWNPFPVSVTRAGEVVPPNLARVEKVTERRLKNRRALLGALDGDVQAGDISLAKEFTALQEQVIRILQQPSIHDAFDLDRESPELRDKYGRHRHGTSVLLGRRLIEAGAKFVTVYWGKEMQYWGGDWKPLLANNPWDTHRNHFPLIMDSLIPRADQTLAALLEDMSNRGLLEDTLVVWMGEFGRSPKISSMFSTPGREHWPHAFTMMMAGAGIRGGNVYGSTDEHAAYVKDDPVSPADITATILDSLGIDPATNVASRDGEQHVLSTGRVLCELF
ncbi:MAG: hypothetical protein CMJ78_03400 [Planctomycetaceae bacterium]|nr:hypothetical protein [Planctomycetaceae bacterium]